MNTMRIGEEGKPRRRRKRRKTAKQWVGALCRAETTMPKWLWTQCMKKNDCDAKCDWGKDVLPVVRSMLRAK